MEVPVEQRLSSRDGSIGFNFGDAIQKLGSFDFGTSSASVQLPPNLVGTSVEGQSNNVNTLMLDDSIVTEEAPSRFAYLYKTKGIKDAQRQRMEESLHRQKQRRYDYQNHVRRLTDLVTKDEQLDDRHATADSQQMDWKQERKSKSEQHRKSLIKFQNQLMFSEWLLEKPERFEEDWVMVAVPKGRRNLIIATHGSTVSYSKNGMFINQFSSHLPGGGRHKHKWNNEIAILDCIYNEDLKTYYVLDMMFWKQTPLYDTETQFRFYWLQEKFQEIPEVMKINKQNPYRFEPLTNFASNAANISDMMQYNTNVPLDGLLFYHKETHYTFGDTPLVLWLKPYMLPEAIGIMVPEKYVNSAPSGYRGFASFREQRIADLTVQEESEQIQKKQKYEKHCQQKKDKIGVHDSSLGEETMQIS